MNAADDREMRSLHGELARELADRVKNGDEIIVPAAGEAPASTQRVKASAATLNVARAFLKDNGIEAEAPAPRKQTPVQELEDAMADAEADTEFPTFTH